MRINISKHSLSSIRIVKRSHYTSEGLNCEIGVFRDNSSCISIMDMDMVELTTEGKKEQLINQTGRVLGPFI